MSQQLITLPLPTPPEGPHARAGVRFGLDGPAGEDVGPAPALPSGDAGVPIMPLDTADQGPDILTEALLLDSPIFAAAKVIERSGLELDPDFVLTKEVQSELLRDVPAPVQGDLRRELIDATSFKHAELIKDDFMEEMRREMLIAEAGGKGLALRVLANVVEPVNLALALSTGGLSYLSKAGALRSFARAGALTAAEAAAIETFLVNTQGTRDSSDIVLSALGAFVLGGAAGAAGRSAQMAHAVGVAQRRATIAAAKDAFAREGLEGGGAARAFDVTEPLMEADVARQFDISTDPDVPRSALGSARFDAVGKLGQSSDPFVRDLGRALAEEGVGVEGHGVVRFGASEFAALTHRRLMTVFRRTTDPAFRAWLGETGKGWKGNFDLAARAEFWEQVGEAVLAGGRHASPNVTRAAKAVSDTFARYLAEAKKVRVHGLDQVPFNPEYLPRIRRAERLRELVGEHGESEIRRLIAKGIRAASPDMERKVASRIARGLLKRYRRLEAGMDAGLAHGLRTDDVSLLREILRDADLDDDAIETTIAQTKAATEKASTVSRAKRRVDMDLNAAIRLARTGDRLQLSELFETNAEQLLYNYSRVMSGWIGMARQVNIRSPGDLTRVLGVVRSRGEELGRSAAEVEADIRRLEFLAKGVTGQPLENDPAGVFAKFGRGVRDMNFLRIGAAFGLAQLPEMGVLIATAGLRNTLAHLPALRGMIRRGVDGKLDDTLAAEIEDMLAPGVDRLLNAPATRWEEHGFATAERGLRRRVDDAVQVAKRATADIGGLSLATTVFQRMAARGIMQKLLGFAHGAKLSKAQLRRLKGMGIAPEMLDRIKAQMRKHATTESSFVPGRRVLRQLNPDTWDDAQALDTLVLAVHREARRVVQENDIGTSAAWLHTTTGKMMTQFRTFSLTAWSKATLHNVHHRDFQAWMNMQMSMLLGGMAYVAQQSVNVGDREEREKRLSVEEIGKAAFQRTAVASLLPMLVDSTATTLFRTEPLFAYGRSSGLATGALRGVPAVDLIDRMSQVAGMPAVLARPDLQFTKRDYRNLVGLLPVLGGMLGIRRVADALGENLPERAGAI